MDSSDRRSIPGESSPEVAEGGEGFFCCFCARIPAGGGGGIGSGASSGWLNRGIGALMKVREWSELVAGPRWKTFIRRFNRNSRCSRVCRRFQYDPLSYALNFDDGSVSPEIDSGYGDFLSSRYAITPPAKPRMELGDG